MNYYNIINDTIEFIEQNIKRAITLDELAERAFVSKYHFLRVFKALTGKTPKDYIDERKLTEAARKLSASKCSVIDAAFEYGFESHEAFTRRFKGMFMVTPGQVKRGSVKVQGVKRIEVIERDFTNNNNKLFTSFEIKLQSEIELMGNRTCFDPYSRGQLDKTSEFVSRFVRKYSKSIPFEQLYGVVQSERSKPGIIDYFTGVTLESSCKHPDLEYLALPASEYAVFTYCGDMRNTFEVVFTDICNALLLTDKQLNKTSVDLFEAYGYNYHLTGKFSVYVPIK